MRASDAVYVCVRGRRRPTPNVAESVCACTFVHIQHTHSSQRERERERKAPSTRSSHVHQPLTQSRDARAHPTDPLWRWWWRPTQSATCRFYSTPVASAANFVPLLDSFRALSQFNGEAKLISRTLCIMHRMYCSTSIMLLLLHFLTLIESEKVTLGFKIYFLLLCFLDTYAVQSSNLTSLSEIKVVDAQ